MESLVISPGYLEPWGFELYDFRGWDQWFLRNWEVSVWASVAYVGGVFWGRHWMQHRKPFDLRSALILWNLFLCIGSGIMFARLYPELLNELQVFGVKHSICNRDMHTITASFWGMIFAFSKIVEFGDTAFIILRKQKLVFLHWWHHISVAIYCFYAFGDFDPASRYFSAINAFIHTIMYGYYAMKAMRVNIPKSFAMFVTSMQIIQMVIGLLVNAVSIYWIVADDSCRRPHSNIFWNSLIYASYFVLFVNFFMHAYGPKRSKQKNE